jgi:hypothetical protein
MLVRNIAGLGGRVGLAAPAPFSFGTSSGDVATPVNVQPEQGPTAGYTSAVQILTGSVAGGQPVDTTPAQTGVIVNQAAITGSSGSATGNYLLAGAVVLGTIYLLAPAKPKKAKKSKYTLPLLIGGGVLALSLLQSKT